MMAAMNSGPLKLFPAHCVAAAALLCGVLLSACGPPIARFELASARAQNDLFAIELKANARVIDGIPLHEVSFNSLGWDDGRARPIRIQAVVAVPPGTYPPHSKPALVFAHGLGDKADPQAAADLCRNLDVVTLALSGPGLGGSEGRPLTPQDSRALFAGAKDERKNWLYVYVYAILRSITYLQTRPEVDAQAIAVTGFSLGGVATFIANGVDDRIRGALPVAASGGLRAAALQDTWLHKLVLSVPGQKLEDEGPAALFRLFDPLNYAGRQRGALYMLIGAQDEYFPLAEAVRTYAAVRAPAKNLTLVPDYDHGWYFGGGCPARCMPGGPRPPSCPPAPLCPTSCPPGSSPPYCGPQNSYNRHADFNVRWSQLLRTMIARHVARWPRPLPPAPTPPKVVLDAGGIQVRTAEKVGKVRLAISYDCGFTYNQILLAAAADGTYRYAQKIPADAIFFAEVESTEGAIATSIPEWPLTCRLRVREFGPHPQPIPDDIPKE